MEILMILLVHFMDNMKQIWHKRKESHLPKFGRYNMAQSQLDVVAVKGFTVNLMICSGGTVKFKTMLASDPSLMSIIMCVNDSKAPSNVFEQGSSISYHPKR